SEVHNRLYSRDGNRRTFTCLCLDREQEWAGFPAHDPEVALHGDNLAYVLYMMQDSRAHLLLTQNHLLDRLPIPDGLSCLCLDREQEWAGFPAHDPEVA
ncbi:hypothetical protein, partial [Pseudomonas aeruginosa]|uniref:hypothetical protein n=1 Tax=Pseudomonas aeruginosa TaxID=287 RepID=UPI0031B6E0F4